MGIFIDEMRLLIEQQRLLFGCCCCRKAGRECRVMSMATADLTLAEIWPKITSCTVGRNKPVYGRFRHTTGVAGFAGNARQSGFIPAYSWLLPESSF